MSTTTSTHPAQAPAAAPAAQPPSTIADPMPIAFGLFAFALGMYAVRFFTIDASTAAAGPVTEGLNYAVLAAGIGEVLASILGLIRGMGFPAYVNGTFGIWLLGFFGLVTKGAESESFTPNALAWYSLVLIVPVVIMAVPAFVHRIYPFMVAFVALVALLLLLGLGYHDVYSQVATATKTKSAPDLSTAVNLLKASAWAATVAAVAIWYVFATEVYKLTGVIKPKS